MGQSQGKERGEGSGAAGGNGNGSAGGSGSSSTSHIKSFDGGALVPQGVYTGPQDYDHGVVRSTIVARKMAPFYPGLDDEDAYAEAPYNTECPICFLYYPSPLNHTRCCGQAICTECFVQIKRADPNHTNPPSSEPAACPYCQETEFGVVYHPPPPGVLNGEVQNAAGTAESAKAAREQAEESAEGGHHQSKKRKSFRSDDPVVITTDAIRPDWQAKLQAAEATLTRRANRRIIMRQVGERLIPVGVSSSRMGAELPPGSVSGPGGAIIIGENTRWPGSLVSGSTTLAGPDGRRGSRSRRSEFAQFLQNLGGGPDMEEVMMMEAMRLSLIEHEEQQRRQAKEEAEQRQRQEQEGESSTAAAASAPQGSPQSRRTLPRSSSLSNETMTPAAMRSVEGPSTPAAATATLASPLPASASGSSSTQLGLSSAMMAELSELVDGGLPGVPTRSTMPDATTTSAARAEQMSTALPINTPGSFPTSASTQSVSSNAGVSSNTTTPIGTPSRLGSNPNNPFRARMSSNRNGNGEGNSLF